MVGRDGFTFSNRLHEEKDRKMDTSAIAKELVSWLSGAKEFISTQAPLLATEIIRWGIIEGTIMIIFCCALFIVAVLLLRWAWNVDLSNGHTGVYDDSEPKRFILLTIFGLFLISSGVMTINGTITTTKATFTPRVYLIETITGFVK